MNDKELKEQLKKEMLDLCETNSSVMTYMECLMRKYENLQSKIDKAIEFIKEKGCYYSGDFDDILDLYDLNDLLNILQGDDK